MDYAAARSTMVDCQLRPNKVTSSAIIEAFQTIPREAFLPEEKRAIAYVDEDLTVVPGRSMIEPMVLARLLQAADLDPQDLVLEVGCATGYGSAILSRLGATVVALEEDPALIQQANAALSGLEIDNVVVVEGALREGYAKQAPYNVILITGGIAEVPKTIQDQLADGGRLVTVLREDQGVSPGLSGGLSGGLSAGLSAGVSLGVGQACLFRRSGEQLSKRSLFDAATPALPGFAREPGFVF